MTTNKIPTDEEIIMNILGCETKDDLIGWKNGEKGQFSYGDIEVAIKHARAAGREEQRNSEKLNEEMLHTIFPNSIKSSNTFGYGIIESQEEFIAEFRKYILDAKERGAAEQREKQQALLKKCLDFYKEELEAIGGCDHTVGICVCRLIREADDLEEAIRVQAEGPKEGEQE